MDRFQLPLNDRYIDGNPLSPVFMSYDPHGEYLHHRKLNVLSFKIVDVDAEGIPLNMYHGVQHYNPTTISQYALELYSILIHHGDSNEVDSKFRIVIDWCLCNQTADGGWPSTFNHMFFKGRVELLSAPWYSAMAQGLMISALTRAATRISFDYKTPIRKSLDVILRDVANFGVRRMVFDRYVFYEEYPTTPASCVLNGFMFCLVGLYDGYKATGETEYWAAFNEGLLTLETLLPLYDLGNGSSYDLTHVMTKVEGPNKARPDYHRLHVKLLSTLDVIAEGRFSRVVSRWDSYLRGNVLITN